MTFDDDPDNDMPPPYNENSDVAKMWFRRIVYAVLVAMVVLMTLRYCSVSVRAQDRGYMPPPRYTQPDRRPQAVAPAQAEDPLEYYAEDWVVLDQDKRTVCRDPYIMRDIKIIKCISRDPVR